VKVTQCGRAHVEACAAKACMAGPRMPCNRERQGSSSSCICN
jgi:hypothetical protein